MKGIEKEIKIQKERDRNRWIGRKVDRWLSRKRIIVAQHCDLHDAHTLLSRVARRNT